VLAPAVGHLAGGVALGELGDEVEAAGLVPGLVSLPQPAEGGGIAGEVWWVDRFGNCQLNIDPEELETEGAVRGEPIEVRFHDEVRSARWVETYADAKPSELVLVVDSYGLTSLALDRQSAAAVCALKVGSGVTLVPRTSEAQ
jgi:S-adenosylmethionine hydrolase